MICNNCKKQLKENTKFCPHCGIVIDNKKIENIQANTSSTIKKTETCKTCGNKVNESAKFCSICGNDLGKKGMVQAQNKSIQNTEQQSVQTQVPISISTQKPKKGNRGLKIAIIILSILVVCGGAFAGYKVVENKKELTRQEKQDEVKKEQDQNKKIENVTEDFLKNGDTELKYVDGLNYNITQEENSDEFKVSIMQGGKDSQIEYGIVYVKDFKVIAYMSGEIRVDVEKEKQAKEHLDQMIKESQDLFNNGKYQECLDYMNNIFDNLTEEEKRIWNKDSELLDNDYLESKYVGILNGLGQSAVQKLEEAKQKEEEAKQKEEEEKQKEEQQRSEEENKKEQSSQITKEQAMDKIISLNSLSYLNGKTLSFMEGSGKPQGMEGYSFQVGINGEERFETIGFYFVSTTGQVYNLDIVTDKYQPVN